MSFVCGAQFCANGDIAYHNEYLILTLVAKEFAEKFNRNNTLIFLIFVCKEFLYYIKLLIFKLFTRCSAPLISGRVAATALSGCRQLWR